MCKSGSGTLSSDLGNAVLRVVIFKLMVRHLHLLHKVRVWVPDSGLSQVISSPPPPGHSLKSFCAFQLTMGIRGSGRISQVHFFCKSTYGGGGVGDCHTLAVVPYCLIQNWVRKKSHSNFLLHLNLSLLKISKYSGGDFRLCRRGVSSMSGETLELKHIQQAITYSVHE